jgi:hypothetical protein
MKKTLLALMMLALLLPALPQVKGAEVSIDFFYNNLSGGNWIEVGDYGYGWQPDASVSDPNWRPYADGYWAYTDYGWTWISYEDFGWATYHYGRWARLADHGWVWFPGSDLDWGPAWVSWRTGGDYIGWAPLPPRGPGIVYGGLSIGGRVDIEFDIGPAYYNFIDVRFIGEPVLRDRIFPYSQNVTYISNTVNVTNISVQNNVVYNYGPDYNVLSTYSSRPIQRLNIEREQNVDLSAAAKSGALTKVQGDKLLIAAPNKISKSAPGVAPPNVKTKVAQPKIERGWAGVSNEAQLKEKIKTENPKNVPPPTHARATGRAAGAASPGAIASPTATAPVTPPERGRRPGRPVEPAQPSLTGTPAGSPGVSPSPFERGKGRPGGRPQPGATGAPAEPPTGASPAPFERGKGRSRPGATPEGVGAPSAAASPAASPMTPERGKGKGRPTPNGSSQRVAPPDQTAAPETTQPPGKKGFGKSERKAGEGQRDFQGGQFDRGVASPSPEQPGGGTANVPEQGRQRGRGPQPAGPSPVTGTAPSESHGGKQRGQGAYAQPGGAPSGGSPAETGRGQGKPATGKKKGEKESPSPTPQ